MGEVEERLGTYVDRSQLDTKLLSKGTLLCSVWIAAGIITELLKPSGLAGIEAELRGD